MEPIPAVESFSDTSEFEKPSLSATSSNHEIDMSHRLLRIYRSFPENERCADCRIALTDPVWASVTFGAFLCAECAGSHRELGMQDSRVKCVQLDTWSENEIDAMVSGNKKVDDVYGKYLLVWIEADPSIALSSTSTGDHRVQFVRDKYIHKKFATPPPMATFPQPQSAQKEDTTRHPALPDTHGSMAKSGVKDRVSEEKTSPGGVVEVTKRFANYFISVGRGSLAKKQKLENTNGPTDLRFLPAVIDSYPQSIPDDPIPPHISQFAFPQGFQLREDYAPPTLFSFVLTNTLGIRVYVTALQFYEELHPLEIFALFSKPAVQSRSSRIFESRSPRKATQQQVECPSWMEDWSSKSSNDPGRVFSPKCIMVASHYPYYTAFRQFLQLIYRVTLFGSPIPLERYISNFVSEVPLPPQGKIQVQLSLPDRNLIISRPPRNGFPLVDFGFRSLFQMLDINNVLTLFTCAALEYKIVFYSKHISLLTPVAETLLSLLLPFSWQGAYIPVLPVSLLDVVEAPVPFIVGIHADCLSRVENTIGVIFVDLDHNRVTPAIDEYGCEVLIPKLPDREASKLRASLSECAKVFAPFAAGIDKVDLAYPDDEHLEPIDHYAAEFGQTVSLSKTVSESNLKESFTSNYPRSKWNRKISAGGSSTTLHHAPSMANMNMSSLKNFATGTRRSSVVPPTKEARPELPTGLVESVSNETSIFSSDGIRRAFLRLFVAVLKKYVNYVNFNAADMPDGKKEPLFDDDAFLRENTDAGSKEFMTQLIATQMFRRFLEDRVFNPELPEVLFFDHSINQKLNRYKSLGKKKLDCSFLEDTSDDIQETFIAPPPSMAGLHSDSTMYTYPFFPILKKSLVGQIRHPRELFSTSEKLRNVSQVDLHPKRIPSKTMMSKTSGWEEVIQLVIHLQAQYRMFRDRDAFLDMKHASICIQLWYRSYLQMQADRTSYQKLRRGVSILQAAHRAMKARELYLSMRRAASTIQIFVRACLLRLRYRRAVNGFRQFQAQWRGYKRKKAFHHVRRLVVRVQSCARGFLSRKKTEEWKQTLFKTTRQKIYEAWNTRHTPLLYRSKFWLTFNSTDFFCLGLLAEEVLRLQRMDKLPSDGQSPKMVSPSSRRGYLTSLSYFDRSSRLGGPKDSSSISPLQLLEAERQQLYDRLRRRVEKKMRKAFYQKVGIRVDSKRRKRHLANIVWTDYTMADASAEIVLALFSYLDEPDVQGSMIDSQKQLRLRADLASATNAAFTSMAATSDDTKDAEIASLRRQIRTLQSQNETLKVELNALRESPLQKINKEER